MLAILTPEKTVFEGPVEYVEVPGTEGCLGCSRTMPLW
jgi:F0F1-type ATP synthase epsilon subunit